MKVRYSNLALSELDAILASIQIGQFPESTQEVAHRPGVRRLPLLDYPYVIHYAVGQYEVVILRIIHGARRSPWE